VLFRSLYDFAKAEEGRRPLGWKLRGDSPKTTYLVRHGQPPYLEGKSMGSAVSIGYEREFSLEEYPVLKWTWQVIQHPQGADERNKKTADSAAGLYVVMAGMAWPRTLKFVWSASVPVGETFSSPYDPKTMVVVLRGGDAPLDQWLGEEVNVLEYLRKFFPTDAGKVRGMAFMTDSDNTKSSSEGHLGPVYLFSK
jgi:hypothetical protein